MLHTVVLKLVYSVFGKNKQTNKKHYKTASNVNKNIQIDIACHFLGSVRLRHTHACTSASCLRDHH